MSESQFQAPPPLTEDFQQREEPPKSLGRYRILNEVGRGATAFVYKAYDPQLDRFLAIKVLRQELARDKDYRQGFIKEARLAAQLTHPGIVTIYDVGITDKKPYIAMELLEGVTLEEILSAQGKLNSRTVLAMSLQLSQALAYAHTQGVVHRDIKPGNIVVLRDKKTVKLTDFGIAILEDPVNKVGQRADKVLGTPEYMAPEQVLGKPVDARSDLYSTGVLIFRMLMGLPPFVSDDLGTLFKQIIKSKPPKLHLSDVKTIDGLQDLVRKLLQKHPARRFQSAQELTADLRAIQSQMGDKSGVKKQEFISLRFRWTATMAGVVFVSMCISLAIVYFMQYRALSGITFDYGHSIARMLAFQSSESILLDDQVGLNALVRETSNNEQLRSVYVMDNDDRIVASTVTKRVGAQFVPPVSRELKEARNKTLIYQRELDDQQVLFDIETPIFFSDKPLGKLYVSFSADSMYAASKTTLVTMLSVMMITLSVVFIVTLVLARRTSKDYHRVTQALNKLSVGRVDARLISDRNDEAGQLFSSFNRLASFLEGRFENRGNTNAHRAQKVKKVTLKKTISPKTVTEENNQVAETVELDIISRSENDVSRD